ncbi:putative inhibitor of apoptosis isoform X1 [Crassostrea angulata]|uniref:putative inhibitor of apoptosis isoform X1 n=1 Tax=Magallana angulata TaxID=2784310 RepID=UPI0022B0D67B|nr:putative inhibitor of apoptosis isoform X1 [Crassostrea angulata]XP_052691086.1 putative inhibitor of apoptosis isoform X1 [Crassostrea angulata]XP_052691087.1 putative inhibitor of apoptosis isoform X1 [Crassostrea angulata]XP_052691088.1 putative inhibitor of apoptosis isoform X1 [Crassostrea angulata]
MNYEGEKERASRKNSTRGITLLLNEENNQNKERHRNPTSDTNFSNSEAGKVRLETDCLRSKQNGVRENSLKESLDTISRYTRSFEEFVQKEISSNRDLENQAHSLASSLRHSMNMELIRLMSFHNFPSSKTVSTLRLARQGFYYSMEYDVTICFACGFRKRDWRSDDVIEVIHRNMSPDCPLLSAQPTSNIQIVNDQRDGHCMNELKQQFNAIGNNFPSRSNRQPSSSTSEIASSGHEIKREQNTDNIDKKGKATSSHKTSNDLLTKTRIQQDKINAFIRNLDPLGINFDRPKYPSYSVLAVRVSSFADWPSSLSQTPRDLAVAGFLYAGYGDYTRCFFCGGGLRNWEPGDDPWTEHARWFPKCAFVRQNKGDEFVALVQIQHQELEAMGAPNEHQARDHATGPENVNSERSSEPDVSTLPAFQSVLEMGYPSHVIQQAFDFLKNKKECIDIKAEEVMEVILSGDDIPPSSVAKTSDYVKEVTARSYEDSINANEQQTKSSLMEVTKESDEADTRSLIEENRQLKDLRMCKICMEKDASIAMLPCGHLCCCTDCAPAMRKCPICRQFVKGTVRTWLA